MYPSKDCWCCGWNSGIPRRGWVRDILKSTSTPTHPGPGPSPASDIWWPSLVGTEGRTIGKRAVRILLECFLVNRDSSVPLTLSDWCKMVLELNSPRMYVFAVIVYYIESSNCFHFVRNWKFMDSVVRATLCISLGKRNIFWTRMKEDKSTRLTSGWWTKLYTVM